MRLRSIIRTISASLTTAIIVSCTINGEPEGRQVTDYLDYSMGEPAWTAGLDGICPDRRNL